MSNPEKNCTYAPSEADWENCGKPSIVIAKISFGNGLRLRESACEEHLEEFNKYFLNVEGQAKFEIVKR